MIKYISQSPFIPVVLSGLIVLVVLLQCFAKRKFLRVQLISSCVLTFFAVLFLVFFDKMTGTSKTAYTVLTYIGMLLVEFASIFILFTTIDFSILNEKFVRTLTKSLDETKFYVYLDKKDRIRKMSQCLMNHLGVTEADILNKNFFDIVEAKYRIVGMNGEEALKEDVKKFYYRYDKRVRENENNSLELNVQDDSGRLNAFYFQENDLFSSGRYVGRILLGEMKDEESLMGMEKDLSDAKQELGLITSRFKTILGKTNDGIYFNYQDKDTIWVNDILVDKLCLNGNTLSHEDFYKNMKPEDVVLHKQKLASMHGTDYEIVYRYSTGSYDVYVKEAGQKIISESGETEFCGIMTISDNFGYEKTNTSLDSIGNEAGMQVCYKKLLEDENTVFMIAYFRITSIPEINEKFGRPVGNHALSEYVDFFKKTYVSGNYIFRVSGLEFVAFITAYNRMEALKNSLKNNEKCLHMSGSYANEKVSTEVVMGLSYTSDTMNRKDALKNAKDALRIASNPQFTSSFAFYQDVK